MAKGLKTGGRKKGTPNKITKAFRTAVLSVFNDLGGETHMGKWATDNPTEFYKIAARLIPTEVVGAGEDGEHVVKHTGGIEHTIPFDAIRKRAEEAK